MPELRKDPITGRWVIISTERQKRPSNYISSSALPGNQEEGEKFCPFCPGNEEYTPGEISSYPNSVKPSNGSNWSVRVVPNKFPALKIEGELDRRGAGMFDLMSGIGAHEVIIETPEHDLQFADLDVKSIEQVLSCYRDRMLDLRRDSRLRYVLIFKNHGKDAGATLEHSHSQLIALPIVPKSVLEELRGSKDYYAYKERCAFCDIIRQENQDRVRVVAENPEFITIAPFASRFPFETWILPKRHDSCFEDAHPREFVFLAKIFKETLMRLNKALGPQPYNFILHTSPLMEQNSAYYHWHFEITTRLTRVAGFERGSGFFINPTPPEDAAKYLRKVTI